ncbi:hypothetical protein [Methanoculleus sp.]|uniref:hypothetical protein n=1 Tax=Methanoculleus sp. TaxID=90427 RepID=UPI001BD33109|nr:hypothetical protein [Methanoculleus sp.]
MSPLRASFSTLILFSLLAQVALPAPAVAETTTIVFQDIGLATQDIDVFDAGGNYTGTVNTTGALTLDGPGPHTLKRKPQPTNQDPGTLLQQLLDILKNNLLVIALILVGIFFLARRH